MSKVESRKILTVENCPKLSRRYSAFDFHENLPKILPKHRNIPGNVENVKNIPEFLVYDGICQK